MVYLLLPLLGYGQTPPNPSAIIDTAGNYLFVRETYCKGKPMNRSPVLDQWFKDFGFKVPGSPCIEGWYWCEIYAYKMVDKVCKAQGIKNPMMKTASVSRQLKHAKAFGSHMRIIKTKAFGVRLLKGDKFYIKAGRDYDTDIGKSWPGHTGFVREDNNGKRKIKTREGNSNKAGSRNGDKVLDRERDYFDFIAVTRFY